MLCMSGRGRTESRASVLEEGKEIAGHEMSDSIPDAARKIFGPDRGIHIGELHNPGEN